jgi:hypothetical protein
MQITVLLCYAHQDKQMAQQIKNHLSLLEYNGSITVWDYGNISPGTEWGKESIDGKT